MKPRGNKSFRCVRAGRSPLTVDLAGTRFYKQETGTTLNRPEPVILDLLESMPPDSKFVLEVDCGAGALGVLYKWLNPACRYIGIESNADLAKVAEHRMDGVILGDKESLAPSAFGIEAGTVDCLVFPESTSDPAGLAQLLELYGPLLHEQVEALICVPNPWHWSRLLKSTPASGSTGTYTLSSDSLPGWISAIESSAPENWKLIHSPILTRFFADPFLFPFADMHAILFEEFDWRLGRAAISRVVVDRQLNVSPPVRVLAQPFHLSYPHVFEDGGKIYMIPEQFQSGRIDLYECTDFPDHLEFRKTLIDDFAAVDTNLLHHDGRYWLFTSPTNGSLRLYFSDSLFGAWTPHAVNLEQRYGDPVSHGRGGGRILQRNGTLYRPIQGNFNRYGESLIYNQITELNETHFNEIETCRIATRNVHHMDMNDHLIVIDANSEKCNPFFEDGSVRG